MKNLLAMLIALSMLLCGVAFAEDAVVEGIEPVYYLLEDVVGQPVEAPENAAYEGTWIMLEGGFAFYMPNDWVILPMLEEQIEKGLLFVAATADNAWTFNIVWQPVAEGTVFADQADLMSTVYQNVELVTINGLNFISYDHPEKDLTGLMMEDPAAWGVYGIGFFPASNEDFAPIMNTIGSSLSVVLFEEAAE